ncbi:hypothetical protein RI444_11190 [Paenarthrobacter sp. AT5]|uniref:hypothetical protein n=1 Tax=Paenarthrobacter sp. AT5 TaxID=2973089 RepID=UPI00293435DD|nr:hypothetical protein [Paenarthrobacter sp. AT5]WOC59117.1 hypothetical protein RI444_11190 [Paenarthrobacter sp. AT5]
MKAYSTQTERTHDSWEDLVAEEANGYGVVVMMQAESLKSASPQTYSRLIGPFDDQKKARNKAAAVRRAWKRAKDRDPRIQLLGVSVEPIWPDLRFGTRN